MASSSPFVEITLTVRGGLDHCRGTAQRETNPCGEKIQVHETPYLGWRDSISLRSTIAESIKYLDLLT